MTSMRVGLAAGLGAAAVAGSALLGALAGAPALAAGVVTVQGTSFPDPAHVNLSFVGCGALFDRAAGSLTPMIGRGPGAVPLGERSMGFAMSGGNAAGAMFTVSSMTGAGAASLAVNSTGRSTGVAYAGYQAPDDAGTSYIWLGRADLSTPGGSWQTVSAIGRDYDWSRYDLSTGQADTTTPEVDGVGVDDFVAAHGGDGPGLYTIGFGCNGVPFSVDAFRLGATTYDLEGLTTSVTAWVDDATVDAGDAVTLTGRLHTPSGEGVEHATMILESKTGSAAWQQEKVVDVNDGVATTKIKPDATTTYRWRFVDRPLADGSTSDPVTVTVRDAADPTASPSSPSSSASAAPTRSPSATPSPSDSASSSSSSSSSPSEQPSDSPTPHVAAEDPTPKAAESASPSATPSDDPSPASASASPMSPEATPGQ